MMNMMNRFVEGRGHQREIDMLLEITYVALSITSLIPKPTLSAENKSKGEQFARSEMRRLGLSKD